MNVRAQALECIARKDFDVCVIGAGATGAGCALDSQLRGLKTVLLDAGDFAGATSSASTKLIHGGVRYLEQAIKEVDPAEYSVVKRALRERMNMLHNAPFLTHTAEFLVPCFSWFDVVYFDTGLKLYDWIAGKAGLSRSRFISREEAIHRLPALKSGDLVGAVVYSDGQFDDSRYNIALVQTFVEGGGEALNYARVIGFEKDGNGKLVAAHVEDEVDQTQFAIHARAFVNATGPFADSIREIASPGTPPRIRLSKGVHLLFSSDSMEIQDAMVIPKTEDGRVLFVLPWQGRVLVGTTEEEVTATNDLCPSKADVEYLLRHLNHFLEKPIVPSQIASGFGGVRPLVSASQSKETKKLARDHEIEIDKQSGLISIMGGKWTTYRAMAEDTIDAVQDSLGGPKTECRTQRFLLSGSDGYAPDAAANIANAYDVSTETATHLLRKFGSASRKILDLVKQEPDLGPRLVDDALTLKAEVVYGARHEMAMTLEDVLARRTGLQFHSWKAAARAAPVAASLLARELGWSPEYTQSAVGDYRQKLANIIRAAGLQEEEYLNDKTLRN